MHIENTSTWNKLKTIYRDYCQLTKMGITTFALISAAAGYVLAIHTSSNLSTTTLDYVLLWLLCGLYFVVSGSFILNQSYEWQLDGLMKRTKNRPIPIGKMTALQAFALGIVHIIFGLFVLLAIHPLTAGLALLAVVLYNIFYTILWKKKWAFAAVPGALPGALPVMIGYSAVSSSIFSMESLYLFLLLFLWQMPHFWSLAVHYQKDYQTAGIPVLPVKLGLQKTLYYISFYLLSYLGLVLISPLFFEMNVIYIIVLLPLCIKVFIEFIKYSSQLKWKPFFIWLNMSILVFLWAPSIDLWIYETLLQLN